MGAIAERRAPVEGPEIQFAEAVIDNGRFGGATLNYAPVINISAGSGNIQKDVTQALNLNKSELARMLHEIMEDKRRISFYSN